MIPLPRVGRRGAVLLILGTMWLIIGLSVWGAPTPPNRIAAAHELIPVTLRVTAWSSAGLLAISSAFRRDPGGDRWGFYALAAMPAERSAGWLIGIVARPWLESPPFWTCVGQFAIWIGVLGVVLVVAGWRESTEVVAVAKDDES